MEVPDQGTGVFSVWWEPPSWFVDIVFLLCGMSEGILLGLFYESSNTNNVGSTLMTWSPPKGPAF